jgi:hypothetical protein
MKEFTLVLKTGSYQLDQEDQIPLDDQFKAIPADTICLTIKSAGVSDYRYDWLNTNYAKLIPSSVTKIILSKNDFGVLSQLNTQRSIFAGELTLVDRLLLFLNALADTVDTLDLSETSLELMPADELKKLFRGLPPNIKTLFVRNNPFQLGSEVSLRAIEVALAELVHLTFLDLTDCFPKMLDDQSALSIARCIPLSLTGIKIPFYISKLMKLANTVAPWPWLHLYNKFQHPLNQPDSNEEKASPKHNRIALAERAVFQQLLITMEYAYRQVTNPQYYNFFTHYLHHGRNSQTEIKRAIFAVNQCQSLTEAISIITKLLKRHKGNTLASTSGLHTNSFDTVFMQLLWADGNKPTLDQSGLLTLDKNSILELVCYPLSHMAKGEFRLGTIPEGLSGANRLPVEDRAAFRTRTVEALEAILGTLELRPVIESAERLEVHP